MSVKITRPDRGRIHKKILPKCVPKLFPIQIDKLRVDHYDQPQGPGRKGILEEAEARREDGTLSIDPRDT